MHIRRILMYSALIILNVELITYPGLADDQHCSNNSQSFKFETNDSEVNATISKYPFFILDYYAPGCEPCESMNSSIYQLSSELNGQAAFGTINIANNSMTARRFGIDIFPTLLVFNNGTLVHRVTGYISKSELVELLTSLKPGLNTSRVSIMPYEDATDFETESEAKTNSVDTTNIPSSALGTDKSESSMPVNDISLESAKKVSLIGFGELC
jgi:thioredoxin 1